MTFAPASLLALRSFLHPLTGLSAVSLGIVGDTAHAAKGTSYHLGADDLSATAYSRQTARDVAGLSNAASAIDIGTFPRLRAMSMWLVVQARQNAPGTSDMREIIYSPDGVNVLRWDRERGYASVPKTGEADDSHRSHTHISWYRDAEKRDHVVAFRPFFVPIPDTATEDIVKVYSVPGQTSGAWPAGTAIHPGPTGASSGVTTVTRRFLLVGQDHPTAPTRYLVDGGGDGASGAMAWLPVKGITGTRVESWEAGKAAAIAAARGATR